MRETIISFFSSKSSCLTETRPTRLVNLLDRRKGQFSRFGSSCQPLKHPPLKRALSGRSRKTRQVRAAVPARPKKRKATRTLFIRSVSKNKLFSTCRACRARNSGGLIIRLFFRKSRGTADATPRDTRFEEDGYRKRAMGAKSGPSPNEGGALPPAGSAPSPPLSPEKQRETKKGRERWLFRSVTHPDG